MHLQNGRGRIWTKFASNYFSELEDWKRMRKQLDRHMMRPSIVTSYLDDFNEVTTDFIQFVRARRSNDGLMDGLDEQLFRWSLEGMLHLKNDKKLSIHDWFVFSIIMVSLKIRINYQISMKWKYSEEGMHS